MFRFDKFGAKIEIWHLYVRMYITPVLNLLFWYNNTVILCLPYCYIIYYVMIDITILS